MYTRTSLWLATSVGFVVNITWCRNTAALKSYVTFYTQHYIKHHYHWTQINYLWSNSLWIINTHINLSGYYVCSFYNYDIFIYYVTYWMTKTTQHISCVFQFTVRNVLFSSIYCPIIYVLYYIKTYACCFENIEC